MLKIKLLVVNLVAIGLLLTNLIDANATDNPAGTTLTSTLTGTSPLTNEGTITLSGYGINNGTDGATIINSGTISVTGANNHGIASWASLSNITNSGLISVSGSGAIGIIIWDNNNGGIITNTQSGVISVSGWCGIALSNDNSTLNNYGLITGNSGIIAFNNSSTVNNFGRILGTSGSAIYFQGINNTLNLLKGSVIVGNIYGNTGSKLNINLGSGASYAYSVTGSWTVTDLDNRPMVTGSGTAYSAGIGAQETASEMLYQRTAAITKSLDSRLYAYAADEANVQPYWLDVYYADISRDAGANYSTRTKFSNDTYGMTVGYKLPVEVTPLELIVNAERSNLNIDSGNQKVDSTSVMAGLLAPNLTQIAGAQLSAKALLGYTNHEGDRKVMTNSLLYDGSRNIAADYDSYYAVVGANLLKLIPVNDHLTASVLAGLDLNTQHIESYAESDYFAWNSRTLTQFQSRIQAGLDYQFNDDKAKLFARVGLERRDLVSGETQHYSINDVGTITNVSFNTSNSNDTYLTGQVGVKAQLERRIQLFGALSGMRSSDTISTIQGNIGLRADF